MSHGVDQEYNGKLNFTTDAWSSPNHRAFVAFCVHLEHKGKLLSMPLDIVEVATVSLSHHDILSQGINEIT